METNWAQLSGKFDIKPNELIFKGEPVPFKDPQDPEGKEQIGSLFGHLISDQSLSEGEVEAEVIFQKADARSACELIINYDSETKSYVSAGISSLPLYGIMENKDKKLNYLDQTGDHSNLISKKPYKIKISLKGSRISLFIDGVEVLSYVYAGNLKQSQAGLLFFSKSKIIVKNFKVKAEKPKIFVITEFSEKYEEFYQDVIKEVCSKDFNLEVVKADEIHGPGIIIADIVKSINEAKIIIAEISEPNPNVFYELGFSHAMNKPTILIAEKQTKLPFDVSPFRTLFYQNTIAGRTKVVEGLRKQISSILNN